MWVVTDTTKGVGLEWRNGPTMIPVLHLKAPGLTFTQAELIKKQFENLGLRPEPIGLRPGPLQDSLSDS